MGCIPSSQSLEKKNEVKPFKNHEEVFDSLNKKDNHKMEGIDTAWAFTTCFFKHFCSVTQHKQSDSAVLKKYAIEKKTWEMFGKALINGTSNNNTLTTKKPVTIALKLGLWRQRSTTGLTKILY